jgi:N-acetylglucosamine-6-phosphate deacetylase
MAIALLNGRVHTDRGFVDDLAVLIEGPRIVALADPGDERVRGAQQHDLGGGYLLPGFIDCQVNGGGGVLFNDAPSVETIRRIGAAHRAFGTSGFLPTLISDDPAIMRAAIEAVEQAIAIGVPGVLGIHLEGPFLSAERKGVHNAAKFHTPQLESVELVGALRGGKTLLTVAPECVPLAILKALQRRGMIVAAGHSAATYMQTRGALDNGVRGFTHLFNAMTPLQSREPGMVGAALEDAASWCGVIVDGHHVHPAALRVALAAKPRGKLFLVTDAMPVVGAETSTFFLNGQRVTCLDGKCLSPDGVLAGSSLDMAGALRNTVQWLGVALDEAARMASTYPAAFLSLERSHGRIAAGYQADFVVLNEHLQVNETWIGGVL